MSRKSYETIQVKSINTHIIHASLNRPKKYNAMSLQMFADLASFFTNVNKDPEARVVILTGNGKNFCAGIDLTVFGQQLNFDAPDGARSAIKIISQVKPMQAQMMTIMDCRVPVLVGIHGLCIGGGIDLSSLCDIRYCTQDSKFSIKEVDIGMAADIGTLQMFPFITNNESFFRQITYTGRFFDSKQAQHCGFISKVVKDNNELQSKLLELATQISSKSPVAIWTIKNVLQRQLRKHFLDNFDHMATLNSAMLQNNDMKLAIMATMSKQKAQFPKL